MANQISFGGSVTAVNRFTWRSVYNNATSYLPFDCVSYLGTSYVCLGATTGNLPTNATFWDAMTSGSAITSVAGRTGTVVLSSLDLTDKDSASGVAGLDASGFLKAAEANIAINPQTGTTYTVVTGDRGKLVTFSNASPVAVSIAQATGSFSSGWYAEIENIGTGLVTITPTTSTVDGAASITLAQYQSVTLVSNGTNYVCMRSKPLIVGSDLESADGIIRVDGSKYARTDVGILAAIAACPDGGTVYLPAAVYIITGTITITKRITIAGAGWASVLQVGAGVGATTDVFLLKPLTSSVVQGISLKDFYITPASGTPGRSGIMVDGTNGPIGSLSLTNVRVDTLGSYAFNIQNASGQVTGTPFLSTIKDCVFVGGVNVTNCGDNVVFINTNVTGVRDFIIDTITGAHGFTLISPNITSVGGTIVRKADQGLFIGGNFEATVTSTEANSAMIDIQGDATTPPSRMQWLGNFFGGNNLVVTDTVRVDRATEVLFEGNTFAQASGVSARITANAVRTRFRTNTHAPNNNISSWLADLGTNTDVDDYDSAVLFRLLSPATLFGNNAGTNGFLISSPQLRGTGTTAVIGFTAAADPTAGLVVGISGDGVTGELNVGNGSHADNSGHFIQTGSIDLGTHQVKRIRANRGTALVAGDFVLSAGWGTTATVTAIIGTDQAWTITVTSSGTGQAANPTITLTFHDGTFTNSPITVSKMSGGTGTVTNLTEAPTATTNVITFQGTPGAGSTYVISSVGLGR